jgi:hypothetical protein
MSYLLKYSGLRVYLFKINIQDDESNIRQNYSSQTYHMVKYLSKDLRVNRWARCRMQRIGGHDEVYTPAGIPAIV